MHRCDRSGEECIPISVSWAWSICTPSRTVGGTGGALGGGGGSWGSPEPEGVKATAEGSGGAHVRGPTGQVALRREVLWQHLAAGSGRTAPEGTWTRRRAAEEWRDREEIARFSDDKAFM